MVGRRTHRHARRWWPDKGRDLLAMVIAESASEAHNAAGLVEVAYDVLEANIDPAKAGGNSTPLIHEEAPANLCMNWQVGDADATEAELATRVATVELINNRTVPNAIEPRSSMGII